MPMLLVLCGSAGGSPLRHFYPHLGSRLAELSLSGIWKALPVTMVELGDSLVSTH